MTIPPVGPVSQRRILIAEDDPSSNTLLTGILKKWGFDVVSVTDGLEALRILSAPSGPRLAILDWMMPGKSGFDVATDLARDVRHPIHVILLTAKSDRSDVVMAMQAGVNDFLSKPVDFQALRARIETGFRALEVRLALEKERLNSVQKGHLASLGVMAAGAAHEINNPLTIILGSVRKIKGELESSQPDLTHLRERADKIEAQARRISEIIAGLNALTTEGEEEQLVSHRASDLQKNLSALTGARFLSSGIELEFKGFDRDLVFECRPQALGRAVLQLLNNSFDAVQVLETKWVRVSCERGENFAGEELVRVRVSDSGPGIPKELRSHLKEPFFTTKDVGKGAGLGLAVANGIVEGHRGSLELNEQSEKTEFIITLPVRQLETKSTARAA